MLVRFMGTKPSLGYQPGQVYDVRVRTGLLSDKPTITHPQPCPYDSWDAFWRNWEKVPGRP